MPRLRRCECCRHGVGVTHFSNENYVRILAQCRPHGVCEGGWVVTDLDLLHNRTMIHMLIFDGILDGDDVLATADVDQPEKRGQSRRLTAPRWSCEEHQPLATFRQLG